MMKWLVQLVRLGLLGAVSVCAAEPTASRPNIVVFLTDDHSVLDSTVYGSNDVRTPNMQRLAKRGLTFERAFVVSPSCAPSRAALLTGLMPSRNGAEANHSRPRADIKKLPAYFKELGYDVVAFGKVGHYAQTAEHGFDRAENFGYHEDVAIPNGVKWLRQRRSERPLCLFLGTNWPHVPWPATGEGYSADRVRLPSNHVDTPETRTARASYYAAVGRMDADLGLVLDAADETLGRNTLFLTTADHGAQWPFGKWNCYDTGIRVPMIAAWTGKIAAGTRTSAMVSWVDLLPTLVELAGGTPPADLDGRSFAAVLMGEKREHRDRIFTVHSSDGDKNVYPTRSVRTADWKYIRNLHPEFYFSTHIDFDVRPGLGYFQSWTAKAKSDPGAAAILERYHVRPAEELYNLAADPDELHNLAADPSQAERLAALGGELDAWMKAQGDAGTVFGKPRLLTDPNRAQPPPATKPEKPKGR
jgi:arylsulfatase A-like enzyme